MVGDASTLCNFCARFSDVIPRSIIKRRLFPQGLSACRRHLCVGYENSLICLFSYNYCI